MIFQVEEEEVPVKKGCHCCACLGILEGFTLNAITKKVYVYSLLIVNFDYPFCTEY